MLKRTATALILSTVLFSGCSARSLNPVVSEREAEAIHEIVGVWRAADDAPWPPDDPDSVELDSTLIEIAPQAANGAHAVAVTATDGELNGPENFEIALMRSEFGLIGHAAIGEESKAQVPESAGGFFVEVYYPIMVQITDDGRWMAVTMIDEDALESSVDAGHPPLACVDAGNSVLISAKPIAIREFLLTMPERFRDGPMIFRRENETP